MYLKKIKGCIRVCTCVYVLKGLCPPNIGHAFPGRTHTQICVHTYISKICSNLVGAERHGIEKRV